MPRLALFSLVSIIALATTGAAHAVDYRIDPDVALRADIRFVPQPSDRLPTAFSTAEVVANDMPYEYASAMTWYRTALADGYTQPPLVASPWARDEQLPEPLQWTWASESGDIVSRTGKGTFRLSLADNRSNWFRDVDCQMMSWPGGDREAPMNCDDGVQRTMRVPGDGIVLVDDVQYVRVFDSDATTLPPEETISIEEATTAALEAAGMSPKDARRAAKPLPEVTEASPDSGPAPESDVALPDQAPVPPARQQAQAEPAEPVADTVKPADQAPATKKAPAKAPAKKAAPPAKPQELPAGLY